ncbi:MAG: hypothetical protein IPN87_18220 [Saprospiraceae bacterium]|nr:hypothetical protein [Candidatus Brachybacter algidus]
MKIFSYLILAVFFLSSCSKNEGKFLPGEKYTIDTIMYREYRKIDSIAKIDCEKISEQLFRSSYDSLLRLRVKDISSIKGPGIPPKENNFPKAVEALKRAEKKQK